MSRFNPAQPMTALEFGAGTRESNVITMPAVGDATQGDYVNVYNAAGTQLAAWIDIDADGTAPTGALYVASDSKATLAYKNAVLETYVLTFADTAGTTQADYVMIYDAAGNSTAVNFDIDANTAVPTGALYVGADAQIEVDIVGGGTATNNATLFHTAVSGVISDITFTDNLDGTVTVALDDAGPATDAVSKDDDDSGAGSTTIGTITKGVVATTAIAGGALLAAATLTDVTFTDNGGATVTVNIDDIGNASDCVPKLADDSTAGSITVSATDGSALAGYEGYPTAASSPVDLLINPATIS